jgi:hypothetical protein
MWFSFYIASVVGLGIEVCSHLPAVLDQPQHVAGNVQNKDYKFFY